MMKHVSPQTPFPPLQVGFDARLVHYRQGGIAQYMLNLLRAYATLAAEGRLTVAWPVATTSDGETGRPVHITVFHSRKEQRPPADWLYRADDLTPPDPALLARTFSFRPLWTPAHHRFEQVALPVEIGWAARSLSGLDVFHSSDFIPPFIRYTLRWPFARYASVITIHDLAFLRFPHILTPDSVRYYEQVRRAATSAERSIAVSQSTARDTTMLLNAPQAKMRVVYEAAAPHYRPLSVEEGEALAAGGARKAVERLAEAGVVPSDPLVLFVSTIEPRKNLATLLRAMRLLLNDLAREPRGLHRPVSTSGAGVLGVGGPAATPAPGPRLVIVGNEGWLYDDVHRLVSELRLRDAVIFLKNTSSDELLWLYHRATVYALPSLYEGFGLTPLEAMTCGLPVVVSNVAALPEVVGDAGILLPPDDVNMWMEALKTVLTDPELRADMRAKGLVQATRFSWRTAALETLAVYAEAAAPLA